MKKSKGRPHVSPATNELPVDEPPNSDDRRPVFCLEYLSPSFDLKTSGLTKDAQAAFATRLQELASQTWGALKLSGRHKQGPEKVPVGKFKCAIPDEYQDETDLLVFRYHGKLPMAGIREGNVFHILAIERHYGELYAH